jgi:phage repressor protein C with HTH and peptisase S24 domain
MIDEVIFVDKTRETRKEDWLIYEEGGDGLVGVAYYAVNVMSDETGNLYLTALHPKYQRAEIGSEPVKAYCPTPAAASVDMAKTEI